MFFFNPLHTPSICLSVSWTDVFVVLCSFGQTVGTYCFLKTCCFFCHLRALNIVFQTNKQIQQTKADIPVTKKVYVKKKKKFNF